MPRHASKTSFQRQMQPVHSLLALLIAWLAMEATVALESLQASSKARPYPGSPWGRILWAHPDIPPRWLVPVTNETSTVRVPAARLARRGITAQPGEMVDLKVT